MFDHFGMISSIYDRLIRSKKPDELLALLDLPREGKLLDAGGGTGRIGAALHPHISQVIVVDISFGMLQQAKKKDGLLPVCSPSELLPFPSNTFDRIIMVDALHHVEDATLTISELWRITKPGGRILIEEPDIRSFSVKLVALAEKALLMRSHFISPPRISRLFQSENAQKIIKTQGYTSWIIVNKLA